MIKPYYETDNGRLYHGDCLDIMREMESDTVQCVVTSPPYNKALNRNYHPSDSWQTKTGLKIIYGKYDDDMDENKYQKWQIEILNRCIYLLKSSGNIFYNHKNRTVNHHIITPWQWLLKIQGYVKQEIIWFTKSFVEIDKIKFLPGTERIYWIVKNEAEPFFNPENAKYTDVWEIPPSRGKYRYEHPAPYPITIASRCIDSGSDENSIILDPFLGSGTTAVACERLNRRWIGIEISKEYCDIAVERIKREVAQPRFA